jgi:hypothetical protein
MYKLLSCFHQTNNDSEHLNLPFNYYLKCTQQYLCQAKYLSALAQVTPTITQYG